jgi:amino-acid N-acetyltransferase
MRKVFVLTTQSADWFLQLGFVKAAITDLPKERQKTYNTKRKSMVLTYSAAAAKGKRPPLVE